MLSHGGSGTRPRPNRLRTTSRSSVSGSHTAETAGRVASNRGADRRRGHLCREVPRKPRPGSTGGTVPGAAAGGRYPRVGNMLRGRGPQTSGGVAPAGQHRSRRPGNGDERRVRSLPAPGVERGRHLGQPRSRRHRSCRSAAGPTQRCPRRHGQTCGEPRENRGKRNVGKVRVRGHVGRRCRTGTRRHPTAVFWPTRIRHPCAPRTRTNTTMLSPRSVSVAVGCFRSSTECCRAWTTATSGARKARLSTS